ncbi:MAG: dephospho-CoA kinase [Thermovirgaceae bacterium]|nr:dephospho-CoA kinase [Synergistales bacterium]HPC75284.1 dephospho-CoA kinase [Synergistales bacterium]HRS48280.1 dephospho-CoA kinase [Thermovirgaceae bacterium]HRU90527.1 dephospho-CoA kinase [Thermovirgaceae bacterium]
MLVIGLTGDVGAGKSTVSSAWASQGARVISADPIVAELWKRRDLAALAVGRWGRGILNAEGTLDHVALSGFIFGDEEEYRWACGIIHPLVREEMEKRIDGLDGWVVAEIPLLFEKGVPEWVDLTVYIEASEEERVRRNAFRGWDRKELHRRERWLLEPEDKKTRADLVISNDGTLDELVENARDLGSRFLSLSSLTRVCFESITPEVSCRLFRELSRDEKVIEVGIATDGECEVTGTPRGGPDLVVTASVRSCHLEVIKAVAERIGGVGICVRSSQPEGRRFPKEVLLRAMKGEKC